MDISGYTRSQGLGESSVIARAKERDGNLWGGTQGSSAVKIARNGLVSYSKADGFGHNLVSSVFENRAVNHDNAPRQGISMGAVGDDGRRSRTSKSA